jgi:hypothetical protein
MSRANFLRSLDSGRAVRYSDRPAESAGPRLGADFQDASASARPILAGGARNGETATSSRRSPERGGSRVPGRRGRRWHPRAWRSPRVEEGGQLHISNFRRNIWRPAAADANLPGLRIHDLRHAAVALWIAAGASPKEVAASAGHTSVSFVLDRYGHLFPRPTPRSGPAGQPVPRGAGTPTEHGRLEREPDTRA